MARTTATSLDVEGIVESLDVMEAVAWVSAEEVVDRAAAVQGVVVLVRLRLRDSSVDGKFLTSSP